MKEFDVRLNSESQFRIDGVAYEGVNYLKKYMKNIPQSVIEKDYGCGDPTQGIKAGDVVLDLGSGAGKMCYLIAQQVGSNGKVFGLDSATEMISFANRHKEEFVRTVGYDNVEFVYGAIEKFDKALLEKISDADVEKGVLDVVVSNCVLNLISDDIKPELFKKIFECLKEGGRLSFSDIVCDEMVPAQLKENEELWNGCIAGAFHEEKLIDMLKGIGFQGIEILKMDEPRDIIENIEFRAITIQAFKPKSEKCYDHLQAVIYKGPFDRVNDDDGHEYVRGVRTAVCNKTFRVLKEAPYKDNFIFVEPRIEVEDKKKPFDCGRSVVRTPREQKNGGFVKTMTRKKSCCC